MTACNCPRCRPDLWKRIVGTTECCKLAESTTETRDGGAMNIVTWTEYGGEPTGWHRAEWVTRSPGIRAIRYETDYDLTCLLRNLAVAGGLAAAWRDGQKDGWVRGQANGIAWWRGMEVRKATP